MAYRLGVDVGGTFTDLFLVSDENGGGAVPRQDPVDARPTPRRACSIGVSRICDEAGIGVADVRNILHGTTVATNAVLESKGARVGLITTHGLQADPPSRALADARAARGLDHHDQARPAGAALGHPRGGRAAWTPAATPSSRSTRRRWRRSSATSSSRGSSRSRSALVNSYVSGAHEERDRGRSSSGSTRASR